MITACIQLIIAKRFESVKKTIIALRALRKPVEIKKEDIIEQNVRGSGPGGQCVNMASNKIRLIHKPTGIVVESHKNRETILNQKDAMKKLTIQIDNLINGPASLENLKFMKIRERKRKRRKEAKKKTDSKTITDLGKAKDRKIIESENRES
jgi:peptide chain release factor